MEFLAVEEFPLDFFLSPQADGGSKRQGKTDVQARLVTFGDEASLCRLTLVGAVSSLPERLFVALGTDCASCRRATGNSLGRRAIEDHEQVHISLLV